MKHILEIERNPWVGGYDGSCSCSDPSYEDGWEGHVVFHGDSEQEVRDYFEEHVMEETE